MTTVRIPPVLRPSVGGEKELQAEGSSIGEILDAIADSHPDARSQLFAADGQLNRYVNVYLNDEDVRVLDGLETVVGATDTIVILPAMAGGAPVPSRRRGLRVRRAAVR
jgi:molybdopterin converting factor small subunit